MDVRGWLLFVRDWLAVLLIGVVLGGGAAFAVSSVLPKTFEASTTMLVGQSLTAPNPDYSQLLASQVIAQTYAEVAAARPNLEHVISTLGLDMTAEELAKAVGARAPANSTFVIVTASSGDAQLSASIANALAQSLLDIASDPEGGVTPSNVDDIDAEIDAMTQRLDDLLSLDSLDAGQQASVNALRDQLATLRAERTQMLEDLTGSSNRLSIIEPATTPDEPVSPRILLNTAIGAFLGLVITTLAAYMFESALRPDIPARRGTSTSGTLASVQNRAR